MEIIITDEADEETRKLTNFLSEKAEELKLENSVLYYNYPFFRDDEGEIIPSKILLISEYGIFIIWVLEEVRIDHNDVELLNEMIEQLMFIIRSKLMINRNLRKFKKNIFDYVLEPHIYAPILDGKEGFEYPVYQTKQLLISSLKDIIIKSKRYNELEYKEIRATLEGSKPLKTVKKRDISEAETKGNIVDELEKEIALFDKTQRVIFSKPIKGPMRIRGLAGSGKTIILAMKAALLHLKNPEAEIIYTFWTKSLYQLIKQFITRFYTQYSSGQKPNWNKLQILHGWGSKKKDGFYRNVCIENGIYPKSLYDLKQHFYPFDEACKQLLKKVDLTPKYDYILIDEGQDFPASFIQICNKLSKENKFILAYDDQQSIFQSKAPNPGEIFGYDENNNPKKNFIEDLVLHKVYRNPREVLVCAHALGFGIYGEKIVQVIEDMDYWGDIGYVVKEGEPKSGSIIKVERPKKNSLPFISNKYKPEEIITVEVCENLEEEIAKLIQYIKKDINDEKLNPDDILVITVNDFTAKSVLKMVSNALEEENILFNDIHSDPFNIMNFFMKDRVTLSTIHKAKGNEAYSVYIVGIDFLFQYPNLIKRNRLFTAITRSKAWVTLMGVGKFAKECQKEIEAALLNYPFLIFKYPDEIEIKRIRRELSFDSIKKMKKYKLFEELISKFGGDLSDEELEGIFQDYIKTRKENE